MSFVEAGYLILGAALTMIVSTVVEWVRDRLSASQRGQEARAQIQRETIREAQLLSERLLKVHMRIWQIISSEAVGDKWNGDMPSEFSPELSEVNYALTRTQLTVADEPLRDLLRDFKVECEQITQRSRYRKVEKRRWQSARDAASLYESIQQRSGELLRAL